MIRILIALRVFDSPEPHTEQTSYNSTELATLNLRDSLADYDLQNVCLRFTIHSSFSFLLLPFFSHSIANAWYLDII